MPLFKKTLSTAVWHLITRGMIIMIEAFQMMLPQINFT
jgi:hypothetical protein